MAVRADAVVLAAQHERRLRVRLEADDAVDDVHAHFFEGTGPADVGLLVESSLELDDGGDLLAVLLRLDERLDDRAVEAGAVERLLDAEDGRVVGRLGDEGLDRGGERVVGVVDEHVALAQHGEELVGVVRRVGEAGRRHRRPRLGVQVGAVERVHAPEAGQVERGGDPEDAVAADLELGGEEVDEVVAHVGADLEAEGLAEAAAAQLHLDGDEEVVGLVLLEGQVGVAGDPEGVVGADRHAGEEAVEVGRDDLLEGHEALAVGHDDEAGQRRRHLDPGDAALAGRGSWTSTTRLSERLEM